MVTELIKAIFRELSNDINRDLLVMFGNLFSAPVAVLQVPAFITLQQIAAGLALGGLSAAIGWQALRRIWLSMDGASDTPPEVLIRRGLTAGLTVTAVSLLGWGAASIAESFRSILIAFGVDFSYLTFFFIPNGGLAYLLLNLVFIGGALVLLLQRAQLYMEFAVLMIIGPLAAVALVADENPAPWAAWKREMIAICITPLLQLMLFILFARVIGHSPTTEISLGQWISGFSLLALLWRMPRWARQFTATTGTGHAVAGAGVSVGRMAVMTQIARAAITKGV